MIARNVSLTTTAILLHTLFLEWGLLVFCKEKPTDPSFGDFMFEMNLKIISEDDCKLTSN
jgi:hypothetical protein